MKTNSGPIPGVRYAGVIRNNRRLERLPDTTRLDANFAEGDKAWLDVTAEQGFIGFRTALNMRLVEIGETLKRGDRLVEFKVNTRFESRDGHVKVASPSGVLTLARLDERGQPSVWRISIESSGKDGFRLAIREATDTLSAEIREQIISALQEQEMETGKEQHAPTESIPESTPVPALAAEPSHVSMEEVQTHLVAPIRAQKQVVIQDNPDFWQQHA